MAKYREKKKARNCKYCGCEFDPHGMKIQFCSEQCRRYRRIEQRRDSYRNANGLTELSIVCKICGQEFKTYDKKRVFCSPECNKQYDIHRWKPKYNGVKEYTCKMCGKQFFNIPGNYEYCNECKEEKRRHAQETIKRRAEQHAKNVERKRKYEYEMSHPVTKECVVCGCDFETVYRNKKYCSSKCKKRAEMIKNGKRYKKRYKGITIDPGITLKRLVKKQGLSCALCGGLCDWDDKQTIDGTVICGDNYPSVDHILPISKGGWHSWDNVQVAHRICNYLKSDNEEVLAWN